jgi:hypothetical protein
MKMKTKMMKKVVLSKLWDSTPNTKLKAFVFEINGRKGFAWIKSEVVVKEALKI